MAGVRYYDVKRAPREAILLEKDNLDLAARWCGGYVFPMEDDDDLRIHVPNVNDFELYAAVGEYIFKDVQTGAFDVQDRDDFERHYEAQPETTTTTFHPHKPGYRQAGQIVKTTNPYTDVQVWNQSEENRVASQDWNDNATD